MKNTEVDNRYPGILRIILHTPSSKHSNLLIIDYENEKIYRYDPCGRKTKYNDQVNKLIKDYFKNYLDFDLYSFDYPIYDVKNSKCKHSGYCVAYIIKFAYDIINNKGVDLSDIRKFANLVETKFGPLPYAGRDIEYGIMGDTKGRNALIGGLGGALIGGAVTGQASGALLGGAVGGLGGYLLSK